jgi:biopolymer transport protein ExbD
VKNFGNAVSRKQTQVNITSLIDVIFMLVIFFMIGASFEKPAVKVSLPAASAGKAGEKQSLVVTVDSGGAVYFEGREISLEALLAGLMQYGGELPEKTVSLECDGSLSFQKVIEVMDIIKKAGVQNVSIRHSISR